MAVSSAEDPRHHVQFYEDAGVLAENVAGFLHKALATHGAAVAIARPLTLAVIELQLAKAGHDVAALQRAGRLALIDASELLPMLLVRGAVDRTAFRTHIGAAIEALAAGGKTVHAYGELVDILWADGNRDGALTLEGYWSELIRELPVRLLCGYQLRAFNHDVSGFDIVCDAHDYVEPSQPSANNTLKVSRVLAQLEQRARALESEVARRTHVERRMLELLDVTGQLAAASDRASIGRLAVEKGMQAIGAVDGAVWLLAASGTHLELLTASNNISEPRTTAQYREIPLLSDMPVAHAVRTGQPVFLSSSADYAEQFPASWARVATVLGPAQRAFAVLPFAVDESPFGCVVFTFDVEREFSGPDRAFKAILARQCALAFARVKQQEQERALREAAEHAAAAERTARSEIELLYDLIASVNQLADPTAVFDVALQTVRLGAHSDRAAILLFDDDGVMRFKAAHGVSATYQRAVEGHSPWQRDTQNPQPITVDDTESDPAWASYREVFRAEGIRALAFVPIVHGRELIGKFMLYRNEPRRFEHHDLQFTATVAIHVAQAVQRQRNELELARLYREEQEAHMQAEESTRAREEILSVVSHDLRNPLGTILMGATSLLNTDLGDRNNRVRTIAERIHRQADRMARLIEDLVDFAGIQAGQLAIQCKPHRPEEMLSATSDIFTAMAQERGVRLETTTTPSLPPINCDSERIVQVLSNLVANALKVTQRGGTISIGAERQDDEVVFFVRDTGPGIAPDELPQLFERYWRSKHSQYKGAGLGLSIARGIVEAHGGRIWAESELGRGATFYFALQAVPNS